MSFNFGFSYIDAIFLMILMIPNFIWTKHQPKNYECYVKNENKLLLCLERIGEVSVTCLVLVFDDFNINEISMNTLLLLIAFLLMLLYEWFWIRYFHSEQTMQDFYGDIPIPGAVLPVITFLLLAIYGRNLFLFIAALILGIGHIGIHLQHRSKLPASLKEEG